MIRNGLYFVSSKALDGVEGGTNGVMILRNGTLLGGTEFFYPSALTLVLARNGKVNLQIKSTLRHPLRGPWPERDPSASDLAVRIPIRVPKSLALRLLASKVFDTKQLCGCWQWIDQ